MRVDKKARADRLRFVVLDGIGAPVIAESPAEADLVEAYKRLAP
jgi:3-dehydroquinate synthase